MLRKSSNARQCRAVAEHFLFTASGREHRFDANDEVQIQQGSALGFLQATAFSGTGAEQTDRAVIFSHQAWRAIGQLARGSHAQEASENMTHGCATR
ncbi:MAG: hypothetical protein ACTIAQ_06975, partial [Glutamicibacter arilaitensis]